MSNKSSKPAKAEQEAPVNEAPANETAAENTVEVAEASAEKKKAYNVPKGEEGYFHVEMDKPYFNPATGKKESKSFVQKFNVKEWPQIKAHHKALGYTATILHAPEGVEA